MSPRPSVLYGISCGLDGLLVLLVTRISLLEPFSVNIRGQQLVRKAILRVSNSKFFCYCSELALTRRMRYNIPMNHCIVKVTKMAIFRIKPKVSSPASRRDAFE